MRVLRNNIVGIEFNDGFIRLTEVAFGVGGEGRLVRCGRIEDSLLDDASLSGEIRKILVREGVTATNAAIALPDKHFFQKTVSIPKVSRKDIGKYVRKEARKGLNLSNVDFFVDSAQVNESTEHGVKKVEINVLACRKETVLRFCAIIAGAGLVPIGIIPFSAAMFKLMNDVDNDGGSGPVSLIYLGESMANMVISDSSHIIFSRVFHTAGFRDRKVAPEGGDGDGHIEKIVSETRRTLLYCKKDILGRDVVCVRLTGDETINDGILKAFRENLDVKVEPWCLEEWSAGRKSNDGTGEGSLFAVGAAVIAVEKNGLQLVPGHFRRHKISARNYRICKSLLFLFLAGGIISFFVQRTTVESLSRLYSNTTAAISGIGIVSTEVSSDDTLDTTADELDMKKILYLFASRPPDFQRVLKELGSSMPGSVYMKAGLISKEQGRWIVAFDGAIRSSTSLAGIDAFADLINNLESSGNFTDISFTPIDSGKLRKNPDFHVKLTIR